MIIQSFWLQLYMMILAAGTFKHQNMLSTASQVQLRGTEQWQLKELVFSK